MYNGIGWKHSGSGTKGAAGVRRDENSKGQGGRRRRAWKKETQGANDDSGGSISGSNRQQVAMNVREL